MTEENYNYRTSWLLLRNNFKGMGKFKIPIIPKANFAEDELKDLLLIGFDRTKLESNNHLDRIVHFFLYDYKFERVWTKPDNDIEKLKRYRGVMSPDFSMYLEMSPVMQLYNTFRNRWCGAYFASKGMRVIPTVSWGDESTFDFCFEGIPKGSTVAVSTYMVSEYNHRKAQKEFFLKGYNEMLRRIEPERIICYNQPFPEMKGNIIFVDYELSSWKYQNDNYTPSKYAKYICGAEPLPLNSGVMIKQGHILSSYEEKGMGSAFGGEWKPSPNKPNDQRFLGEPGEIKVTYDENGERVETKIGKDGRAERERHYSDHKRADKHTNPHDHIILWDAKRGNPLPQGPINYPDGAPEFKNYTYITRRTEKMNSFEQNRFKTISEFIWCVNSGSEVEFEWKGLAYSITHPDGIISVCQGDHYSEALDVETADEALEFMVGDDRLRDVITQVKVWFRSL